MDYKQQALDELHGQHEFIDLAIAAIEAGNNDQARNYLIDIVAVVAIHLASANDNFNE